MFRETRMKRASMRRTAQIELRQVVYRSGHQGDVRDVYRLYLYDEPILQITHYVEYHPEEAPLQIELLCDPDWVEIK